MVHRKHIRNNLPPLYGTSCLQINMLHLNGARLYTAVLREDNDPGMDRGITQGTESESAARSRRSEFLRPDSH